MSSSLSKILETGIIMFSKVTLRSWKILNIKKYQPFTNPSKNNLTIVFKIWMICLELNWFVYDPRWMLHLSEFVWTLRSSVGVVFNKFLIDATDRSKISSNQKRLFFAVKIYPLLFFVNTLFNLRSSWT